MKKVLQTHSDEREIIKKLFIDFKENKYIYIYIPKLNFTALHITNILTMRNLMVQRIAG